LYGVCIVDCGGLIVGGGSGAICSAAPRFLAAADDEAEDGAAGAILGADGARDAAAAGAPAIPRASAASPIGSIGPTRAAATHRYLNMSTLLVSIQPYLAVMRNAANQTIADGHFVLLPITSSTSFTLHTGNAQWSSFFGHCLDAVPPLPEPASAAAEH
jgi:hypothetical protein